MKKFIPLYHNVLVDNSKSKLTTDLSEEDVVWKLSHLSGIVRYAGSSILEFRKELNSIINAAIASADNHKLAKSAAQLLSNVLKGLTRVYPLEYRSLPPDQWAHHRMLLI